MKNYNIHTFNHADNYLAGKATQEDMWALKWNYAEYCKPAEVYYNEHKVPFDEWVKHCDDNGLWVR